MIGHWGKSSASDVPVWITDHPSAPDVPDMHNPILGTHGVWVEEIHDFDLATVRLPDGSITVMRTEIAKRLYGKE